ncbi:MAG: hypothetical protein MJ086_02205 [Lachnospiraceae bacterium]|nr:hypothetical protein [Lachnospiraceae bacterium]
MKKVSRKSYICILMSMILTALVFVLPIYGEEKEMPLAENPSGWQEIDGERYYFREDGTMGLGWITIENDYYYFYEKETEEHKLGSMAKNTVIDGYVIAPNGVNNQAVQEAAVLVNEMDYNIAKCYNWCANLPYEINVIDDSVGSAWFAKYGFEHGVGNCYVMAATFYYCALLLGYDAHHISGYVPGDYGLTPHSWVEINFGGKTYICDPDFEEETGMDGYMITNGQSDTWIYTAFHKMN